MDFHSYSNVEGQDVLDAFEESPKDSHDVDMVYRFGRMHGVMDVIQAVKELGSDATLEDYKKLISALAKDTMAYAMGAILDNLDKE